MLAEEPVGHTTGMPGVVTIIATAPQRIKILTTIGTKNRRK